MVLSNSEYDNLLPIMRKIRRESVGIEGMFLISADGLPLVSDLPENFDEKRQKIIGSLLAAASSLAINLVGIFEKQEPQHLYFECQLGYVVAVPVSNKTVLIVLTTLQVKLGLLFLDIDHNFFSSGLDPIFPPRFPKNLTAKAVPDDI